ncbi:class I SAM-dependent methyltransferase, partial [Candidatus Pelagibacter sp.]|nr:class I SAM-dependent methyltransferase [Candidatus Pelagibacter sp.]
MKKYKDLEIYKSFIKSELFCTKASSYFYFYEDLMKKYRGKEITFVEIGVQRGGSLLMWRDWFGPKARIIGIDLDENAKKMEKYGFEIFIGDQSSKEFWKKFFDKIGMVDIILDDGAHTNEAQIITTFHTVNFINDGGLLIIEDTGSSYLKKYSNPQKYSFINYSKFLIDDLFYRGSKQVAINKKKMSLNDKIYSIKYFPEIVAFEIDRQKCVKSESLWNKDINDKTIDPIVDTENYSNPRWSTSSYVTTFDM